MTNKVIPLLLIPLILLSACTGLELEPEQVVSVHPKGCNEEIPRQWHKVLAEQFNGAKFSRTGQSGVATHRLVLNYTEGAVFSLYRINEDTVELSLRHQQVRQKFFLESPALADLIVRLCEGDFSQSEPIEKFQSRPALQ